MTTTRLLAKRNQLATQLRGLAAGQPTWTADDRSKWAALSADYDATVALLAEAEGRGHDLERERAEVHRRLTGENYSPGRARPGRDGGSLGQRLGGFNGIGDDGAYAEDTLSQAMRGWALNQLGQPISEADARACLHYGIAPQSNTFIARLEPHGPVRGIERLMALNVAHNSIMRPTSGGQTVPAGFSAALEKALLDHSGVLKACSIWRTTDGRDLPWPTTDDTANEAELIGESVASDESTVEFGRVVFHAFKFTSKLLRVSYELLRDSGLDLPTELGTLLGTRLGRGLNRKLTVGTGAGIEPLGILTASAEGVTAVSDTAISMDDLMDLEASIDPAYLVEGCGWMMSQTVANRVRKLKDGNGDYLWERSVQAGHPAILNGWPVFINNAMPSTIEAGAKTVLFGKLDQYKARIVGGAGTDSEGVRIKRLVERYAEYDEEGFLAFLEADGGLLDPGARAIKHLVH